VTVRVSAVTEAPGATEADTVVIGLCEESSPPAELPPQLAALLADGEGRLSFKSLALTHAQGKRWLLVGLGERERFTAERARVAAAVARSRLRELSARSVCWMLAQASEDPQVLAAIVHGTILADYSFDMHKSAPENEPPSKLEELLMCAPAHMQTVLSEAAIVAQAVNGARDLQNRPANDLTPTALARYAERLGSEIEGLEVQVQGREGILERGMGAFAAVAQGSEQEPALITMRYEHPQARGPLLGLIGKAVTFDSGGISLKPGAKMSEMKFDMSGGAAVLEASAAIARLGLAVKILAVIGATENLPSGRSVKPGDIVVAANCKTIEVNNTDAEGRLVLADCLSHAIDQGAQRLVDLATLTGAVIIALGSTYAGLLSNDDELAGRVSAAGERSGEIVWRLPLHEEYREMIKGRFGDLNNAPEERKAGTIIGATFLQNFVGEVPWVHLDIAGSAWNLGRAYAPKDASGYGVRLLVELARSFAD
jgi:leucyl aminopeptidase